MFTNFNNLRRTLFNISFLLLSLVLMQLTTASPMPRSAPAELGFNPKPLELLRAELDKLVADKSAPGSSVLIAREGKVVFEHATGILDVETDAQLKLDSLFRIYSMTKTVTAFAALQLVDERLIGIDDPIHPVLPEWKNLTALDGEKEVTAKPMTLRHLLTHTSGLSYGYYGDTKVDRMYREAGIIGDWDYLTRDTKEMVEKLAAIPLLFQPGSRWHYGLSSDVLGHVVERVSGLPLDQYMDERIFKPLDVSDAYFDVPQDAVNRFGTNQYRNNAGGYRIQDTPREDPEFIGVTFLSGGGGLVMTTEGFAKFAVMLANRGEYEGTRLIGSDTIELMFSNQLPSHLQTADSRPVGMGLGIRPRSGTENASPVFFGGGAAGTSFMIDPEYNLVIVVMVQVLNSSGNEARTVREHVYESLQMSSAE